MTDIFQSPKRMLRWANENHIPNLEREIIRFRDEKPWSQVVEMDADGVTNIYKIKFTERLSEFLPNMVFDCANHLRPVLDQIAFAIAIKHTRNSKPKSAKFPVGPTENDMLNNLKGGCKDLPPEVRDLFKSFKPYKGGNNALWALNELVNMPKHMTLFPIGFGGGATTWRIPERTVLYGGVFELHPPKWDRLNNELVFARIDSKTEFNANFDVTFTVAFDEVDEVLRGHDPVAVIRTMAREVEQVLNLSETMCKAIGLI